MQAIYLPHVYFYKKIETSSDNSTVKFYELDVIDDQPLLKIKRTSMMHGAVMLYEGEA